MDEMAADELLLPCQRPLRTRKMPPPRDSALRPKAPGAGTTFSRHRLLPNDCSPPDPTEIHRSDARGSSGGEKNIIHANPCIPAPPVGAPFGECRLTASSLGRRRAGRVGPTHRATMVVPRGGYERERAPPLIAEADLKGPLLFRHPSNERRPPLSRADELAHREFRPCQRAPSERGEEVHSYRLTEIILSRTAAWFPNACVIPRLVGDLR